MGQTAGAGNLFEECLVSVVAAAVVAAIPIVADGLLSFVVVSAIAGSFLSFVVVVVAIPAIAVSLLLCRCCSIAVVAVIVAVIAAVIGVVVAVAVVAGADVIAVLCRARARVCVGLGECACVNLIVLRQCLGECACVNLIVLRQSPYQINKA